MCIVTNTSPVISHLIIIGCYGLLQSSLQRMRFMKLSLTPVTIGNAVGDGCD